MEKTKREVENRLNQLRKEVPTRGFERYPSFVKSVSELPAELQSSNLSDLVNEKGIRSIIAFPPQIQHGWNYVQRQALIFTDNEIIHILSSIWPGHSPGVTSVNSSNLLVMKVTLLFLYGFLQVVAQGEHEITFINIEFNTVAWSILSQPLEQFLSSTPLRSSMDKENGIIDPTLEMRLPTYRISFRMDTIFMEIYLMKNYSDWFSSQFNINGGRYSIDGQNLPALSYCSPRITSS
jgi:hypothetical protein